MRRPRRLATCVAALALVAGCGGRAEEPTPNPTTPTTTSASGTTVAPSLEVPAPAALGFAFLRNAGWAGAPGTDNRATNLVRAMYTSPNQ